MQRFERELQRKLKIEEKRRGRLKLSKRRLSIEAEEEESEEEDDDVVDVMAKMEHNRLNIWQAYPILY